jgi:hypothetical protein
MGWLIDQVLNSTLLILILWFASWVIAFSLGWVLSSIHQGVIDRRKEKKLEKNNPKDQEVIWSDVDLEEEK